jgi:hypothetical protein
LDRIAIVATAMAAGLVVGMDSRTASGQFLANGVINSLEMPPAGSVEWQILDRLAATQKYDPRDLPRLARLTVLEAIAMYENARSDLRQTMMGARVEGEMSVVWDAAELFYASVTPGDAASLARARPLLGDIEAAYDRLGATIGSMPGISQPTAFHLQAIARLVPVMSAIVDAMEAEATPVPVPEMASPDFGALREEVRRLVEDLRATARALADLQPAPTGRDSLIADLDRLRDLVQGLDRLLAERAPMGDVVESLRLLRSRLWPVQARILQTARTAELLGQWRRIRQRMNAISDGLGRPRVVVAAPETATTAVAVDRRLLAQTDRAIAALDDDTASLASKDAAVGLEFRDQLGQFRRRLFDFRQQVAAGESAAVLARSLRDIVDAIRRLGERARAESRIFRGGARIDPRALDATTQVVEKLQAGGGQ